MLLFVSMTHCLWRTHCRSQSRRHGCISALWAKNFPVWL